MCVRSAPYPHTCDSFFFLCFCCCLRFIASYLSSTERGIHLYALASSYYIVSENRMRTTLSYTQVNSALLSHIHTHTHMYGALERYETSERNRCYGNNSSSGSKFERFHCDDACLLRPPLPVHACVPQRAASQRNKNNKTFAVENRRIAVVRFVQISLYWAVAIVCRRLLARRKDYFYLFWFEFYFVFSIRFCFTICSFFKRKI